MNKFKRQIFCNFILLNLVLLIAGGWMQSTFAIDNNLSFSGALVTEPCDLDPVTTDLVVDFGTIVKKGLYLHSRTTPEVFTINLINCDISLGKQVVMTFKGAESSVLPGMLSTTGDASGINIAIGTMEGELLPINQPLQPIDLMGEATHLSFETWVEGEPNAIQNETIAAGMFSAIATFEMDYP